MPKVVNQNPLSLSNVGKGDTIERFSRAMQAVFANIKDANTSLKKREILIKVVVTPTQDRERADFAVSVTPKLEPTAPYQSSIIIDRDIDGRFLAHEAISVPEDHSQAAPDPVPPAHIPEPPPGNIDTDLEGAHDEDLDGI